MNKPKTCIDCPAVRTKGNKIYCACLKGLEADKTSSLAMMSMWEKCPIDWKYKNQ